MHSLHTKNNFQNFEDGENPKVTVKEALKSLAIASSAMAGRAIRETQRDLCVFMQSGMRQITIHDYFQN